MDITASVCLGQLALGLPMMGGAIGSGLGIMKAGCAAAGEWAKEGKAGKGLKFAYVLFTAMPLSQLLYGFVFTSVCLKKENLLPDGIIATQGASIFAMALACGVIQLVSAWAQGTVGAAGCRTVSDGNGKGLAQIIMAMGIAETVGLLGMVLGMVAVPTSAGM